MNAGPPQLVNVPEALIFSALTADARTGHDGGAFGMEAANFLRRFNIRNAILSVGAINATSGFMLHDLEEAEYSREAVSRAERCIIVADSAKFGRSAPIILNEPATFDVLVTDDAPPADINAMLERNEIELVVANRQRVERR